jgi:hypothetical protein
VFGKVDSGVFGKINCVATLRAYVVLGGKTTYFETKDTLLFVVQPKGYNLNTKVFSTFESGDVKVYPIPFDQTLNINISSKQSVKGLIEIFSISGKRVFLKTIQLNSGFNHVNLETSTLQKGIYILKLNSDEGELCYKLIK